MILNKDHIEFTAYNKKIYNNFIEYYNKKKYNKDQKIKISTLCDFTTGKDLFNDDNINITQN